MNKFLISEGLTSEEVKNIINDNFSSDNYLFSHSDFSGFMPLNCFYKEEDLKELILCSGKGKAVVIEANKIDKLHLSILLELGKSLTLPITFIGERCDEFGVLTDSSEYLIINVDTMSPLLNI